MELVINEGNDESESSSSGNTDIVSNINRALENPQIRGMVGAVLSQNGIDPSQMGIEMPENMDNSNTPQMESQNTPEKESSTDESTTNQEINANVVLEMVNQIAANSPMGEQTTLGMVKQHIEENPDEINQALEAQGLK